MAKKMNLCRFVDALLNVALSVQAGLIAHASESQSRKAVEEVGLDGLLPEMLKNFLQLDSMIVDFNCSPPWRKNFNLKKPLRTVVVIGYRRFLWWPIYPRHFMRVEIRFKEVAEARVSLNGEPFAVFEKGSLSDEIRLTHGKPVL